MTFTFTGRPSGLCGRHGYIVEETGRDCCTLWHLTDLKSKGLLRLTWTPFWAPLHDALIEDSLDRTTRHTGAWIPGSLQPRTRVAADVGRSA